MESELFGHKRGAFTGAVADKVGLFEKADGGTIFLDEVGDMPVEMQGKLLRVLQAGESKPVGDVVTRRVRVRVIAATNRDLEKALAAGEFRQDLFYRFNTFTIVLPPLRERAEDIPVLAHHFLRKAEAKVNKKVERFSPEALDLMKRYAWPGNLRELENSIERAVVRRRVAKSLGGAPAIQPARVRAPLASPPRRPSRMEGARGALFRAGGRFALSWPSRAGTSPGGATLRYHAQKLPSSDSKYTIKRRDYQMSHDGTNRSVMSHL
jgi:transcriptional regulator with GAF, ATPase, and Fis domain